MEGGQLGALLQADSGSNRRCKKRDVWKAPWRRPGRRFPLGSAQTLWEALFQTSNVLLCKWTHSPQQVANEGIAQRWGKYQCPHVTHRVGSAFWLKVRALGKDRIRGKGGPPTRCPLMSHQSHSVTSRSFVASLVTLVLLVCYPAMSLQMFWAHKQFFHWVNLMFVVLLSVLTDMHWKLSHWKAAHCECIKLSAKP